MWKGALILLMATLIASRSNALEQNHLKLWYDQPATVTGEREEGFSWQNSQAWVRALPFGNGRLGGSLFGGISTERILLNESSMWSGYPKMPTTPKRCATCLRFANCSLRANMPKHSR